MTTIYIILGVVAFGAVVVWLLKKEAEARGRAEAETKSAKQVIHAAEIRAQIDSGNNALSDDDLRRKLLDDK